MKLTEQEWFSLSRLLDEALALPETERQAWLEALPALPNGLGATLRGLLGRRTSAKTDDFLNTLPRFGAAIAGDATVTGLREGVVVGPYRLLRELGRGGMGAVWTAERIDGTLKRTVALKLPYPGLPVARLAERFARERDILAALVHPHIARLYDAGVTADGQPFLALEYVDGQPLGVYCDARHLGVPPRLMLFLQVLGAVQYAHAHLVVHRDLKPSNVLVTGDGQVRLLDFGIAKLIAEGPASESELTQAAGRLLTPDYASPEQIGGAALTTATDIYSLGVILYELLTGERPYRLKHASPGALAEAILEAEVARPSAACKDPAKAELRGTPLAKLAKLLRGDLDTIVLKALKKSPAERYPSVTAFADDIRRYLAHEPVSARPDSLGYRAAKFVRRNRVPVMAATAATLTLIAATVITTWQMVDAQRQRDAARYQAQRAEASSEVMSLMLEELGPGGKTLTLDELVDRGVALLERRYSSDPHLTGLMMVQMARRYMDLKRPQKVRAALARAITMARDTDDAEVMASAQCALVYTELSSGNPGDAARAFAEGSRALARLAVPGTQAQVDCLRAGSHLRRAEGLWSDAIRRLEEAKALLERTGDTRTLSYTSVVNDLGAVYFFSGRWREALANNRLLLDLFERNGRGKTVGNTVLIVNRASLLYNVGEIQASETEARSARERVEAFPDLDVSAYAYAHGRALARLGRSTDAIELLRSAAAGSEARELSFTSRIRFDLARALTNDRQFAAAEDELARAEAIWARDPKANAGNLLHANLLRAEIHLTRGRKEEAQQLVDDARSELKKPTANTPFYRFRVNRTGARVALARGDAASADALAGEALRIAEDVARDPAFSADVGEALLLRGEARIAQGDPSAARPLLERAATSLAGGLGSEHALTQRARDLLAATRG